MKTNRLSPFVVQPGWIIAVPYISDGTFVSDKEVAGEPQVSEVIEVGKPYIDEHGIKQTTDVKKGDVILHSYALDNGFLQGFDKYRVIPFSRVLGIKRK